MQPDPWPHSDVIEQLNTLRVEQLEDLAADFAGTAPTKSTRYVVMSSQPPVVSIDTVNALLLVRIEGWLQHVIGCSRIDQRRGEWHAAPVDAGGVGDSLVVRLKDGTWCHFEGAGRTPPGGDLLGLYAYVRQVPMPEAFAAARTWLGDNITLLSDTERRLVERQATARRKAHRASARRIWFRELRPELLDTPVEWYLRDRGISLRRLAAHCNHLPGCLKFAAELEHPQLGRRLPAMVACFTSLDRDVTAIHRTWLVQRGGTWDRVRPEYEGRDSIGAPIEGRWSLGCWRGACIRRWAGERIDSTGKVRCGVPWRQAPDGSTITLTEGIENGLSLVMAMPDRRVGVTGALAELRGVKLPPAFNCVRLAPNRYDDNPHAQAALRAAIEAHRAAGRQCTVVAPPAGIRDWNEALRNGMPRRMG